jgi:hypothetical protein
MFDLLGNGPYVITCCYQEAPRTGRHRDQIPYLYLKQEQQRRNIGGNVRKFEEEQDAEYIPQRMAVVWEAGETMQRAVAERDIGPPGDSASETKRRGTAHASKELKGLERLYQGRFAEKAKFRLDGFCPSCVPRVSHQSIRSYRGFKEAQASWVGGRSEVLSTPQLGTAQPEITKSPSFKHRKRPLPTLARSILQDVKSWYLSKL